MTARETERETLIETLDRHRSFLLFTVAGLTEEQARTRSTASELTLAGLLQHVAETEEQWMDFAVRGAVAFGDSEVYGADVDWEAVDEEASRLAEAGADWSDSEWQDERFIVAEGKTLEVLRGRIAQVADATAEIIRAVDLDAAHALPQAPWFEAGASWTARRVVLHVLAEISQHAGHADFLREAMDGQKTMG